MNREATASGQGGVQATQEIVWSAGETLSVAQVMNAYRLAPTQHVALERDVLPTTFSGNSLLAKFVLWAVIVLVILLLLRCSQQNSQQDCRGVLAAYGANSAQYQSCLNSNRRGIAVGGFRTSGGGFGGFATGGAHK